MDHYSDLGKSILKVFDGRMNVREFWHFVLFNTLFCLAFFFVITLFSGAFIFQAVLQFISGGSVDIMFPMMVSNFFHPLIALLFLFPLLVATARRMTDAGFSRWFLVLFVVPFFGWIAIAVLAVFKSYDSVPKPVQEPPSVATNIHCPACGKMATNSDNTFCTFCGGKL